VTVSVTMCIPPRHGELCVPIRFLLRHDSTVLELTARHRITDVQWDPDEHAVALHVEITDPETARPVDIRFDVGAVGSELHNSRSRLVGQIERDGEVLDLVGTYLGVVADEN
jgi:hypothetical protein